MVKEEIQPAHIHTYIHACMHADTERQEDYKDMDGYAMGCQVSSQLQKCNSHT
eukprot:m.60358 g.60358  ORF g.60358 m.60358 type:complete len:53 (-) comp13281_c0_seq1:1098-1256(-)